MKPVYIVADNIISPLGNNTEENFTQLLGGNSGIKLHPAGDISSKPFYASLFPESFWREKVQPGFTKFEQLVALAIDDVLKQFPLNLSSEKTGFVLSTTKGNIGLIEASDISPRLKHNININISAKKITGYFGITTEPVIVSHACISGLSAIIIAKRMIQAGLYDSIIIVGADLITRFILSGFQTLQAVSEGPCKPFDADRTGTTLGEAASALILSAQKTNEDNIIEVTGGAVSNDANHISGPSRTGMELYQAINRAMAQAEMNTIDIDFISLHGTATLYNDDMESKAVKHAGLENVPVNSLKGHYGHTLGAAGLVESVISIKSLRENLILPTKGFIKTGTAENINVCSTLQRASLTTCLKTASGFGGCNAAVVLAKNKKL